MEEQQSKKPIKGTWASMGDQKRISFEVNKPIQVTFLEDEPVEVPVEGSVNDVYYDFKVSNIEGKETIIGTSAWTLLFELKKLSPLKGKTVQIVKKLEKGKQTFSVVQIV